VCEDHACLCAPGLCAAGHGRCASAKKGEVLPGEFTIGSHQRGLFSSGKFEYAYLSSLGGAYTSADIDEKSKWRILVNNDNTVVLQNKYYPKSYLSIRPDCGGGDSEGSVAYECATDESTRYITSVSFEVIRSVEDVVTDTESHDAWRGVAFKHVASGYYLDQDLRGRAARFHFFAGLWHVEPALPDRVLLDKPIPDFEKPPMPLGVALFILVCIFALIFFSLRFIR
jgi:hypothetical protein